MFWQLGLCQISDRTWSSLVLKTMPAAEDYRKNRLFEWQMILFFVFWTIAFIPIYFSQVHTHLANFTINELKLVQPTVLHASAIYNNRLFIINGQTNNSIDVLDAYSIALDVTQSEWTKYSSVLPDVITGLRVDGNIVVQPNGDNLLYIINPETVNAPSSSIDFNHQWMWIYNLSSNTYSDFMPTPLQFTRVPCVAFNGNNNLIYVMGGIDQNGAARDVTQTYDIIEAIWSSIDSINIPRAFAGCAVDANDENIFLFGGASSIVDIVNNPFDSIEKLSVSEGAEWMVLEETLSTPRAQIICTLLGVDGKIYCSSREGDNRWDVFDPLDFSVQRVYINEARVFLSVTVYRESCLYATGGRQFGQNNVVVPQIRDSIENIGECAIFNPTASPTINPTNDPASMAPTESPTDDSTLVPTDNPTPEPTQRPTNAPSLSPTALPTHIPIAAPTEEPTSDPTLVPTNAPSVDPSSSQPTNEPTSNPTFVPTVVPTIQPTSEPTVNPTKDPTAQPASEPSQTPSLNPTNAPSRDPTIGPTSNPTADPTLQPTLKPSNSPTFEPTKSPSGNPSAVPTIVPITEPTSDPITGPTDHPTAVPTTLPTIDPTAIPSNHPSSPPSINPTKQPTIAPTVYPSTMPSHDPTTEPSGYPTNGPTAQPTPNPSITPTIYPSQQPTSAPTSYPTTDPSLIPSEIPSLSPTSMPTRTPTMNPSPIPTLSPSSSPTQVPSDIPSSPPTRIPTPNPSKHPTNSPTFNPSISPTINPSSNPSMNQTADPTFNPTDAPTMDPTQGCVISEILGNACRERMDCCPGDDSVFDERSIGITCSCEDKNLPINEQNQRCCIKRGYSGCTKDTDCCRRLTVCVKGDCVRFSANALMGSHERETEDLIESPLNKIESSRYIQWIFIIAICMAVFILFVASCFLHW